MWDNVRVTNSRATTAEPTAEAEHIYLLLADIACGCGRPEESLDLVRRILALAPFYEGTWSQVVELCGGSEGAAQIVCEAMEKVGLLEHGTSIGGSWLGRRGRWLAAALADRPMGLDIEGLCDPTGAMGPYVGIPHYGTACTDACFPEPVDA